MTFYFLEGLVFQRLLPPNGLLAWALWLLLAASVAWWLRRSPWPKKRWARREWGWLLGFFLLTPISILIFSLRLPADGLLAIPALGPPPVAPLMPVFAAIPWVLGLVLLGAFPGVALAVFSGLLLAVWSTRSPFTPLEFALLATLFYGAVEQSYRTRLFTWLRQPLVASALLSLVYPFIYLATSFFWASSDPIASLDFSLARLGWVTLAVGGPLLLAGAVLQVLQARVPLFGIGKIGGQAAPGERSLEARLLYTLGPIVLLAFLALGALSWWSISQAADRLLGERVQASADLAANSVPFLLETGQNLISQLASNTRLADASPATALQLLQDHLRGVPYFEQLVLLDTGGNTIAGFPVTNFTDLDPGDEEIAAVGLAIQGMAFQTLSVPPVDVNASAAQLSFVAAVRNDNGQVRAVLVGRTGLDSNPFARPVLQSLLSVASLGGQAFLIDGDGRVVIGPAADAIMQPYNGPRGDTATNYADSASDGSRRFVDYKPVTGSNWSVVAQWPARLSQQFAIELVLPIVLILILLAVVAYFLLRLSLRSVTAPLQELMAETNRIAAGDLQAPVSVSGEDEVGRLAVAFEKMRQTLKARVEEIQRLLSVSQGITSSPDAGAHVDPILNAALAGGASSARLVFTGDSGKQGAGRVWPRAQSQTRSRVGSAGLLHVSQATAHLANQPCPCPPESG